MKLNLCLALKTNILSAIVNFILPFCCTFVLTLVCKLSVVCLPICWTSFIRWVNFLGQASVYYSARSALAFLKICLKKILFALCCLLQGWKRIASWLKIDFNKCAVLHDCFSHTDEQVHLNRSIKTNICFTQCFVFYCLGDRKSVV